MIHYSRTKAWFVYFIIVVGLYYALPNFLPHSLRQSLGFIPDQTINLGLDLQGGAHLLLEVDVATALEETFQAVSDQTRNILRRENVNPVGFLAQNRVIQFNVPSDADRDRAIRALRDDLGTDITITTNDIEVNVQLSENYISTRQKSIMGQSIEIVRRRVDETGTKEPTIQQQGADRIVLQLPGIDDPERIKALLGKTAKLTFHLVDTKAMNQGDGARIPLTSMKLPSSDQRPGFKQDYIVNRRPLLTGDMLIDAQPSFDQNNRPVVSFTLDAMGTKRFADVTTNHVNEPFAIVLDREVISAPNINEPIRGGRAIITGNFTTDEANDLALLLRAGALPAPLQVIEERTVGPGLGADSIEGGKMATIIGFALVVFFMILVYGAYGVMASVALVINVLLIVALMTMMQSTLTLPGIAGIVLTMGMAVDGNVIIFERIREEVRAGRTPFAAADKGYSEAMNSIVDANITTLIAGALLYSFGVGPIRGFAVTLTIGVLTSMFTTIMLTRLMTVKWLSLRRPKELKL